MRRHVAVRTVLAGSCLVLCLVGLQAPVRVAADTAPSVNCDSLGVTLSADKNVYVFVAAASGDVDSITGYTFSFGDRESYGFTFNPANDKDRRTATVTHAYQTAGSYTATVRADTKIQGKSGHVTSAACQTVVAIPPPGTELPNTGTQHTTGLFAAISATAALLHHLWVRRRADKVSSL